MRKIRLDGRTMYSKKAMYQQFTEVLTRPSYFGHNLDALWDVLTDIDEPTLIEFTYINDVQTYLDNYGVKVLELFQILGHHNKQITVHFYEGDGTAERPDA